MAIPTISQRSQTSGPSRATCARAIPTGSWWRQAAWTRQAAATAAVLALLIVLAGCTGRAPAPGEHAFGLQPVSFGELPGWNADDHAAALAAFRVSCATMLRRPSDAPFTPVGPTVAMSDVQGVCRAAEGVPPAAGPQAARAFFEAWFQAFAVRDGGRDTGLITGYFEPELKGARRKSARYAVPLYRRPGDLVSADLGRFREDWKGREIIGRVEGNRFIPYYERAAIEQGSLAGRELEALWVDDPVEAFFLHIQGSGKVVLDTGEVVQVGYDGKNGHVYRAIGRDLVERGALTREEVSLDSIAAWLRAHPAEAQAIMNKNPSYVFFRVNQGPGPLGAQGVPLTPGRSIAIDRKFLPLGAPVWLATTDPLDGGSLHRLTIAQDTGGAITGPVRADLFWGAGERARQGAGAMKQEGRLYLLLPKSAIKVSATLLHSG